jgi:hypothetical protein
MSVAPEVIVITVKSVERARDSLSEIARHVSKEDVKTSIIYRIARCKY